MSKSSSMETPEARELSLVGKVELRIALAEHDPQLEAILKTYLPPLLLKLASDHVNVRNKVISVCQHINARIKPTSTKLPVAALLKQYKDSGNKLVRHFDLLYIQQGADRLPKTEQLDLLPNLLSGLNAIYDESRSHAAALFNLFLRLLHRLDLPVRGSGDDIGLRTSLGLDKKSENAAFVVSWLGKLFLFSANQGQAKRCPGLNAEECKFLQLYDRKDTWTPTASGGLNLIETKVVAARFLASGAFLDSERFLPALFASADPNSRLSDIGDDMLKRASSSISLEDDKLVEQLFELCLGTGGTDGSLPARLPLQTRVLALLSRSKRSLSYIERGTQIVQEILMPTENEIQNTKHGLIKTGLEASKLRDQVFAFVNWLARISSPAEMRAFAPSLVSQLQGYIKNQGWPRIENQSSRPSSEQLSSRGYCYESIGLLAAACPDTLLLETNLGLLRWLFASLSVDPSGKHISISIEQALSSVLRAFSQGLDCTLEAPLTNLLLYQMNLHLGGKDASGFERVRSTRFVALRFANRCLSYGNVTARLINLISMDESSNDQTEILEEGRKGLDPYWYMISNPPKDETLPQAGSTKFSRYQFPVFFELIEKFFGPGAEWDIQKAESNCTSLPRAYILAVSFCRYILLHHALSSSSKAPEVNSEWERNIDALVLNDGDSRAQIKKYLFQMSRTERSTLNGLEIFLVASMNGLIHQIHGESNISGQCLLELCAMVPDSTLDVLTGKIFLLRNSIFAYQKPTREVAAHIFGLLASREDSSSVAIRSIVDTCSQKIQSWRQATGKEAIHVHGAILAITYYLSRASHRGTMQTAQDELQKKFIVSTLDILNESQDQQLLDAAVVAILEFSLFSALSPRTIPLPHSFSTLTQKLKIRSMSGDEKAILALGYLGMQCDEFKVGESNLHQTLEILFDLHDVKQPEVQFAVGAALTCCSVGWRSKFLVAALDGEGPWPKTPERNKTMSDVLSKVLKHCKTTKPALRQASVIWLLCLVQYCGHLTDVLSQLRNCQSTFKGFLADRESLNQESASRGLTLVYEKGDRSLKDDLIRDLVGSFTGTNAGLAGNVSDETELFEPGALPTGEGSVTTYKDIMSLASEVGDPGLVYRFMSLASNNAIWSSRAAFGRFGLSNILSDSSVDGYLAENPKLYPALFRYRFDPNTNVSNSMNDIWNALVKKPAATIDLYFDSIMDDLLKNILGKEWRVRQASCAAIADLVQGKPLEKYGDYLSRIWEKTFKVCDDIKSSVRVAAMSLAMTLTGILTRSLEATDATNNKANVMLEQVIPFLLSPSGLESSAQDVQAFALDTLLKIIKSGGRKTLQPFVPNIVSHLLALLSSLEPGAVNYVRLNADRYDISTERIDDIRLNSVRGSPMMEAIERCLDFLDEKTMALLSPSLENAIKTAIGLPSKVGSTRVLVSLSTRHNYIFKIYADQFLRLARKQVLDRNDTVSSAFAAACGYLTRLSSDKEILMLVGHCQQLYFDSDDERHRRVSGEIVYAISKYAKDRFDAVASAILPFTFVAKHDASERTKASFQDTWSENVGGSRSVRLYLKEIISLASKYLRSHQWSIKHASARAVASVVSSLGNEIDEASAKEIWPALEDAIQGKTWEGKEVILEGLIQFVKGSNILATDEFISDQVEAILLRESKRNNPAYRRYALGCLGDFVELAKKKNLFAQVYAITQPVITEALSNSHEMDVDGHSGGSSSKTIIDATLANSIAALLKSINPQSQSETLLTSSLRQTLELSTQVLATAGKTAPLNTTFDAYKALFERLTLDQRQSPSGPLEDVLVRYAETLFSAKDSVEQTRIKAAEASLMLVTLARQNKRITEALVKTIAQTRQQERSTTVQQILDRARKQLER